QQPCQKAFMATVCGCKNGGTVCADIRFADISAMIDQPKGILGTPLRPCLERWRTSGPASSIDRVHERRAHILIGSVDIDAVIPQEFQHTNISISGGQGHCDATASLVL